MKARYTSMVTNTAISVEVNFIPPGKNDYIFILSHKYAKNNINFRFIFIELYKNVERKQAANNECYKSKIRSLPGTDFGGVIIRMNGNASIYKNA